jgi:hypothetical protein
MGRTIEGDAMGESEKTIDQQLLPIAGLFFS